MRDIVKYLFLPTGSTPYLPMALARSLTAWTVNGCVRMELALESREAMVLVIDDDPGVRGMIAAWLDLFGYDYQLAKDGREALQMVSVERPDVIVLDIFMADVDGFAFMDELQDRGIHVPIVVMTASASPITLKGLREAQEELKIVEVVRKPFRAKDLLRIIEHAIMHSEKPTVKKSLPVFR